jgi:GH35 family endo-1,4-beta-xylanase
MNINVRSIAGLFAMACATHVVPAFAETLRPAGTVLVPAEVSAFKPGVYVEDKSTARIETVAVTNRPFTEALRLTTLKPSGLGWQIAVNAKTAAPIHKGDVLWVNFQSRRIESHQETGEAVADVTFFQTNAAGQQVRPLERSFSCGPEWTETSIPFVVPRDAPAGAATLSLRFGSVAQSLEIGGITLINCGSKVTPADLPRTATRYEGYAPGAPWRAAAAERIERIRKGDFNLRVTDTNGQPVANAEVAVRMRRHAFSWGTALNTRHLYDDSTNGDHYRAVVEKYFNKVVFDNELKWPNWDKSNAAKLEQIDRALDWFAARDIAVRGHVMVWPSWRHLPYFVRQLENNPDGLRAAVTNHIAEQTAKYGDRLVEWDVINETFANHDLMDILGRDVMLDWYRQAHAGAPQVKLFYNDYIMFHGNATNSPSQYFFDTVKFFKDHGAPISGIGEQGHFGGNPPGPAQIIAALDRFGALGLPIEITEFDVTSPDEQFQTDFMRDFTTAIFSHPAVIGMVQWGFWESDHWRPAAALWRKDWTLTPHGQAWVDLVTKTWWTNADGRTAADGTYATRGFYGDYDVTVTRDGRSKTVSLKLQPGGGAQTVTLP